MDPEIQFRWLTDEEKTAINWPVQDFVAVAMLDNKLISVKDFTVRYRYKNCSTCVGNCAAGDKLVWTRKEYRRQGIFKSLYSWAVKDAGWDKDYTGGDAVPVDGLGIIWRYALRRGTMNFDFNAKLRDGEAAIEQWVADTSAKLGFDN
jgi:hypothetical protein